MRYLLVAGLLAFACFGIFKSIGTLNVSSDLAFLRKFSSDPANESDLYDYLCRSRYWTVENNGDSLRAFFNEAGETNFFPWASPSSLLAFVFQREPKKSTAKPNSPEDHSAEVSRFGCMGYQISQSMRLSNNAKIIIIDYEWRNARRFKKVVVTYLNDLVQDIVTDAINRRLAEEMSILSGFESFGVGDVSIVCGDVITGGNKIHGWVNLGRRSSISAKIFDAATGKRIGENKAFQSVRYVGFDTDSSKRFFFEIPLYVDGGGELINAQINLYSDIDGKLLFTTNAPLQSWVK